MVRLGAQLIARWDMALMCLALTVVLAFELLGVFGDRYVTITSLCRSYLPLWLRSMLLGWLVYHLLIAKGN